MQSILCIDDDMDLCLLLKRFLSKNGYAVETVLNGRAGLKKLKEEKFDLVLCDFRLPDKDGLQMIKEIKEINHETQIIIITGYSDVRQAVKAMKYGAFEYVTKPIFPEEILVTIKDALSEEDSRRSEPHKAGESAAAESGGFDRPYVKGQSYQAKQVQKLIELVAPTDMTVLIEGESGTGKEVVARAIHEMSSRSNKNFIAVDCGALPDELAGSELFGHKKGSFTGAIFDKKGQFEVANGGTLFLDEIGNLSYENQIKLLRALQERKIRRIGDVVDIEVDIRIIAATNEDLKKVVKDGAFREDIFYRINEFNIELPPLRERKEDILLYAKYFLDLANYELGKSVEGFSDEAMDKLQQYSWPGNLREMKNVIKRAVLFTGEKQIHTKELPTEILHSYLMEDTSSHKDMNGNFDLKSAAESAEKKAILQALAKTGNNKSKAAVILNVDRKTLYNKMIALGIDSKE